MELDAKQEQGLKILKERYLNKERFSVLSGYAGSGKSTLVRFIISALSSYGLDPETDVCYCAPTGKACVVLQSKGNKPVSTLHKLLWTWMPRQNKTFFRKRNEFLGYKLLIVDECSMVDAELLEELLKHRECHIIFCGDPAQLPPVNKEKDRITGYDILQKPDVFLDEIHRQALESEIIRFSMDVREGRSLDYYNGNEVKIVPKKDFVDGMLEWADITLCATNNTRQALNAQCREMRGFRGNPQHGDKVICLKNEWDCLSSNEYPLVNGTICTLENPFQSYIKPPAFIKPNVSTVDITISNLRTDEGDLYENINLDTKQFVTGKTTLDWKTSYKMKKTDKYADLVPFEFEYGYAITCHKSQGSAWNKVLVIEEQFPFDKEEHKRWLYTAITRSAERLVLVR